MKPVNALLTANLPRSQKIPIGYHLSFWILYFIFNTLRWGGYYDDLMLSLKGNILGFPIHMLLSYFTVYVLIPGFIFTRRYLSFFSLLITAIFVMVWIKFKLTYLLISNNVWPEGPEITNSLTIDYLVTTMLGELYVISFAAAIKITADWIRESRKTAELEKENLLAELKFLRNQISPHFFFNTLNNLYALALERSSQTPEVILKLSEMMRYLIYENGSQMQSLEKEAKFLKSYIDLERLRFNLADHRIQFITEGELEKMQIPPMLLLSFVENCFKHGAYLNPKEALIRIHIKVKNGKLEFSTENRILSGAFPKTSTGGIGIANVKKRLSLLYSSEQYALVYGEDSGLFRVTLKITDHENEMHHHRRRTLSA